ncbi:hypothetical protein A2U01_0024318, partial [Trifolium medium]|nr:hypothetical protein [Trifolium medium]
MRLFLANYISDSYKFQMEQKLVELKQGGTTVTEYTRRFNELAR